MQEMVEPVPDEGREDVLLEAVPPSMRGSALPVARNTISI